MPHDAEPAVAARPTSLRELAWLFGKLGFTAFGGPAAHTAMMEDEVVRRRGWMTHEQFLDLLGATNLIPGPNSTELAIHIGHARARWAGLVVAGVCFIMPAVLIVMAIAWAYVRFGALPEVAGVLYGIKPVIIAVVVQALWGLGRAAMKTWLLCGVAVAALAPSLAGVNELLVLATAGVVVGARRVLAERTGRAASWFPVPLLGAATTGTTAAMTFGLGPLFLFFLKVGSVLFGSGYVFALWRRPRVRPRKRRRDRPRPWHPERDGHASLWGCEINDLVRPRANGPRTRPAWPWSAGGRAATRSRRTRAPAA